MNNDTNRIRQSQRLELIGTVASGVAHDLNNQLTVILNHLDFAIGQLGADHPVAANLRDVERAANRCAEMTGSLLGFGARTGSRFQSMDLAPVLAETVRLLRRVIPATIKLSLGVEPGLHPVVADATQIQQILVNLSINARDAMPLGGVLDIIARNNAGGVSLDVRDSGCGIPAKVLPQIFEPFFTTKGSTGGSGLGLAMVAAIVEEHGGSITVESEPGEGTAFHLSFPRAADCGVSFQKPAIAPLKRHAQQTGCVLIADDDDLVREVARTALAMRGYRVIEARDGEEAVNLFSVHAHEVDLLFFDMTMPRASGAEALTRVRCINPRVKALLTSGYEVSVKSEFLPKPYTSEALARKVDQMIRTPESIQ